VTLWLSIGMFLLCAALALAATHFHLREKGLRSMQKIRSNLNKQGAFKDDKVFVNF